MAFPGLCVLSWPQLFSPTQALSFFEANEQRRPLTIRTNTLKIRRFVAVGLSRFLSREVSDITGRCTGLLQIGGLWLTVQEGARCSTNCQGLQRGSRGGVVEGGA